jgi:uncharacterized damage-inducible protein DinB
MTLTEWFLAELESEARKSRRVLEQVPEGKRSWKPHERSMELGYLADLVANVPSWVGLAISQDELDVAPKDGPTYQPAAVDTTADLLAALDRAVAQAGDALRRTTDDHLGTPWRLLAAGTVAFEQPRHQVIRDTFLHSAHHRGQLTVYLRLLGSKVPAVYGPTADDKSFG